MTSTSGPVFCLDLWNFCLTSDKSGFSQPLLRVVLRKEPFYSHSHFIIKVIWKHINTQPMKKCQVYSGRVLHIEALTLGHCVACGWVLVQLLISCHMLSCPEAPTMSCSHYLLSLMPVHGTGHSDSCVGAQLGLSGQPSWSSSIL